MASDWYFQAQGATYGPVTSKELRKIALRGKLERDDLIRQGETGAWCQASELPGLFDPLAQQSGVKTREDMQGAASRGAISQPEETRPPVTESRTKAWIGALVAIVIQVAVTGAVVGDGNLAQGLDPRFAQLAFGVGATLLLGILFRQRWAAFVAAALAALGMVIAAIGFGVAMSRGAPSFPLAIGFAFQKVFASVYWNAFTASSGGNQAPPETMA